MAIICDSKQLRALFLYNATDAPDKDPVAELLWTTGGGAEPPRQASRSFEQLATLLQQAEAFTSEAIMMSFQRNKSQPKQDPSNAATPGGPSGQSPSPAAAPSSASKAATSSASETPAFKALFAREAVPASALPSGLQQHLAAARGGQSVRPGAPGVDDGAGEQGPVRRAAGRHQERALGVGDG